MAEIWKPQTIDVYKSWADAIVSEASDKLNAWETSFMEGIVCRLDTKTQLSRPQAEILEKIYVKYTN